jgi:hypothetical protein
MHGIKVNSRHLTWLTGMAGAMLLLAACNQDQAGEDWTAFIQLAQQSKCADVRNKLYVIESALYLDSPLVLHDRAGNCADASFGQILYGATVNDVLCNRQDTIAGPVTQCLAPSYSDMFQTMVTHLDAPNLGLGSAFVVRELPVP